MTTYFLAIDIGASSGRHMLGYMDGGAVKLEEAYRFKNGMVQKDGHLCWDIDRLFEEVVAGIARCKELGKIPVSLGIDTWGVDFILLDKEGNRLGNSVAYRDGRTAGMDAQLSSSLSDEELYARTGIQKMVINTVYQLMAVRREQPELLARAADMLMIPDYLHYLLTGNKLHEYTNSTTTALINAGEKDWDRHVIEAAGLPGHIFGPLSLPGEKVGNLLPAIRERVGFDCEVILPCTHDTASAVLSAPIDEDSLYISSGTWSLLGAETRSPICTEESRLRNLTNEGGYEYRYRYLKNIMGLWMIQQIREECGGKYSFNDLCDMARESAGFPARIDVDDNRFLAPKSMIEEIKAACAEAGHPARSIGQLTYSVYQSLADSYSRTVKEIEALTGRVCGKICIVGGGSKDDYLNELTAAACGEKVTAGPAEGTSIGNLLAQMMRAGVLSGVEEARQAVARSFSIVEY